MSELLRAVFLLPLAASVLLMLGSRRLPPRLIPLIGCGAVGLSAIGVLVLGTALLTDPPIEGELIAPLGQWLAFGGFSVEASLRLDALSLVMAFVITFVGFFIHLYSSDYMRGEEGYGRYFAWLNLFVAAMLLLVLADDLLVLYAGWEGVGLCSYLLIGFWYRDKQNGYAARKAFVMTRAGDALLLVGLLLLATQFESLRIDDVLELAPAAWMPGAPITNLACILLLAGALGKSAQVPLQTWLPDAMAGPTPVSALIHAATMVTAGVYFIARLHHLFTLSPFVQSAIAAIGAVTLLLGAFSALAQNDIKRVLAYSTVSQVGYMFLALGLGAWSAAIFHLMTHAFFKALLFLAGGAVILAANHERDITRMGGLRGQLPLVFRTFVIGGASLAALPLVTAGFFSKELILSSAWQRPALWVAGWIGAIVTAAYVSRLVAKVFFTPYPMTLHRRPGWLMSVPLVVLAAGAIVAGFPQWPGWLLDFHLFTDWLAPVLGRAPEGMPPVAILLAFAAPFMGFWAWRVGRGLGRQRWAQRLLSFWRAGWFIDALYGRVVERPWNTTARRSADEIFDGAYDAIAHLHRWSWVRLSNGQNGVVRRYAAAVVIGAAVLLLGAL